MGAVAYTLGTVQVAEGDVAKAVEEADGHALGRADEDALGRGFLSRRREEVGDEDGRNVAGARGVEPSRGLLREVELACQDTTLGARLLGRLGEEIELGQGAVLARGTDGGFRFAFGPLKGSGREKRQ
jgi:hypothetical protein